MEAKAFVQTFALVCLILLCLVVAAAVWKPVHAAPEDFPGGLITDGQYSYTLERDVRIGKIQAPIGVNRDTHILDFNASCEMSGPNGSPVVHMTFRWYPDELFGWTLHTAVSDYQEKDAAQVYEIDLYGDITNPKDVLKPALVRPCPGLVR